MDKALKQAYSDWLRTFRWDFFGTGTTKEPVTAYTALRLVRNWLKQYPESYAAVFLQRGPISQTIHVHTLIGGIGRGGSAETDLRGSWVRRGNMKIERFHPSLDGVEYMVGQADDIEILGSPMIYKPRHVRGRRGRRSRPGS